MPAEKLEHVPVKSDFFYFETFEARTLFTQLFEIVKIVRLNDEIIRVLKIEFILAVCVVLKFNLITPGFYIFF